MVKVDRGWVEFSFYRPTAQSVYLAGDFNGWRPGELPMVCSPEGYWRAMLKLPPGEYKFRYFADGQWFVDYAAFGVEPGDFGLDAVIRVPSYRTAAMKPQPAHRGGDDKESIVAA
jgi:1,4-alpha-glucan branching enzyme